MAFGILKTYLRCLGQVFKNDRLGAILGLS